MRRRFLIAVLLLLSPIAAPCGEVLDRLVATVNGHPFLQSDVEEELRYECFAAKRPLSAVTEADQRTALGRLIDQELLLEQMRTADFKAVAPEEVEKAFKTFKADYGTDVPWPTALEIFGISEGSVKSHIESELNQLRVIDLRLRSSIQIDPDSIKDYYDKQLLPKLPPNHHTSLQEATPTIRELLVQQKMNDALGAWLESLRAQAQIQRFGETAGDQPK